MTTWTALTTLDGETAATALGAAVEGMPASPSAIAVLEVEDGGGLWEVGAYFTEAPDEAALALLAVIHNARPFAVSKLQDRDWVAQVRRELTPVTAGRFVIHGGHDGEAADLRPVALRIEAAMAFGTGHHGTTRGCLSALDHLLRQGARPARVLDVGTGTGVLAMAAAAVIRKVVTASDIDPIAVETCRQNAVANGLAPFVRSVRAVGLRSDMVRGGGPYDLVFANILARPLRRLAPEIRDVAAPGGVVVLSGVLNRQANGVEGVYRAHGFARLMRIVDGEWTTLVLRKGAVRPLRQGAST